MFRICYVFIIYFKSIVATKLLLLEVVILTKIIINMLLLFILCQANNFNRYDLMKYSQQSLV